jgi:polar amino acid transport system permease protein
MDIKATVSQHKAVLNKVLVAAIIILLFIVLLQFETNSKYANWYLNGAIVTIEISIIAVAMGLVIGIAMGLGRLSSNFILNGIATIYVEILRGTPLLIQIFIIYYGLPSIGLRFGDPFIAGAIALGLNSGAYQAEIIRGGIQSIPRGQMEAARSSGMSYIQAMRHVILPQGFRLVIPPMTNEYVTVIKDSSLAFSIGALELTYYQSRIIPIEFDPFVTLIFTALIYFTLTFSTSTIMRVVERKFRIPGYMGVD